MSLSAGGIVVDAVYPLRLDGIGCSNEDVKIDKVGLPWQFKPERVPSYYDVKCQDEDIKIDKMVAACQLKREGGLPSFGRELVPYFVPGAENPGEDDVNVNTDVDAHRRSGASMLDIPTPAGTKGRSHQQSGALGVEFSKTGRHQFPPAVVGHERPGFAKGGSMKAGETRKAAVATNSMASEPSQLKPPLARGVLSRGVKGGELLTSPMDQSCLKSSSDSDDTGDIVGRRQWQKQQQMRVRMSQSTSGGRSMKNAGQAMMGRAGICYNVANAAVVLDVVAAGATTETGPCLSGHHFLFNPCGTDEALSGCTFRLEKPVDRKSRDKIPRKSLPANGMITLNPHLSPLVAEVPSIALSNAPISSSPPSSSWTTRAVFPAIIPPQNGSGMSMHIKGVVDRATLGKAATSGRGSVPSGGMAVQSLPLSSPPLSATVAFEAPFQERWAGPAFTNSPPPSSLPLPRFPLSRAVPVSSCSSSLIETAAVSVTETSNAGPVVQRELGSEGVVRCLKTSEVFMPPILDGQISLATPLPTLLQALDCTSGVETKKGDGRESLPASPILRMEGNLPVLWHLESPPCTAHICCQVRKFPVDQIIAPFSRAGIVELNGMRAKGDGASYIEFLGVEKTLSRKLDFDVDGHGQSSRSSSPSVCNMKGFLNAFSMSSSVGGRY